MGEFVEAEGLVHLINPIMGGEFTLCGDAFDAASDIPGYEQAHTRRRVVDCPNCAEIILVCRGVKVETTGINPNPSEPTP